MEATVSLCLGGADAGGRYPITYAYISMRMMHGTAGNIHFAYGPASSGYVKQLQDYEPGIPKSSTGLQRMELDNRNTLLCLA